MKRIILSALSAALVACGGGGGGSDPVHCTSEGFPLWCSAIDNCCPPGMNYACKYREDNPYLPGGNFCSSRPCDPFTATSLDYCDEE